MNDEMKEAAVCCQCGKSTNKIYESYWCADCTIKNLKKDNNLLKEKIDNLMSSLEIAEKERAKLNEQALKYKIAFEVLLKYTNKE